MAGPPNDVEPSELFLKVQERPAPSEVVETSIGRVRVMVLRMEQHDQARLGARRYVKERCKLSDDDVRSPYGEAILSDATARELIALATFMPEPIKGTGEDAGVAPQYPRVFRHADDVNKLSADEVTELYGFWALTQRKYGPYEASLSDDDVNAWIRRLVEGGSAVPLARLASHQLADLCILLAQRASSLSQLMICPPENWPTFLDSIPSSWVSGMSSSSEPAADSTPSDGDRSITIEEAVAAAKAISGRA